MDKLDRAPIDADRLESTGADDCARRDDGSRLDSNTTSDHRARACPKRVFLQVADPARQGLFGGQDGTTAEIVEVNFLVEFLPHFKVGFDLDSFAVSDLRKRVFHLPVFHDHAPTDDLQVTVGTDVGSLTVNDLTGVTLAYGNSASGDSSVSFSGLSADVHNALASVELVTTTGDAGSHATVSLSAMPYAAGMVYSPDNGHFYEFVLDDQVTSIDEAYASETVRQVFDLTGPHGDIMKAANVPPSFVIIQRINLGLYAVLGELHATANWRRIAEEIWPFVDGAPSTPLGEEEGVWRRRTGFR